MEKMDFTNQDIKKSIEEIVGHEVEFNTVVEDKVSIDEDMIDGEKIFTKCMEVVTKKKTKDSFIKWLNRNVKVEKYIPIDVKNGWMNIFNEIIVQIKDNCVELSVQSEMFNALFVLLAYTNIDCKLEYINSDNYDLIKRSGLYDYLIDKVGEDFNVWTNMIHNMIVYSNVSALNYMQNVDFDVDLKQFGKETIDALNKLDESKLNKLVEIMNNNDPALMKIKEEVFDNTADIIQQSQEE